MSIRERQEYRFLQDCREKIQTGTDKLVYPHEDSPCMGLEKSICFVKPIRVF